MGQPLFNPLHFRITLTRSNFSDDTSSAEKGHVEQVNLHSNISAKYVKTSIPHYLKARKKLRHQIGSRRLTQNTRIKNPLADLSQSQVLRDVEEFAQEYHLTDIVPELRKGALVARDPAEFESVSDLTETEVTALRDEVLHKWRQPKALYFTIILCSIGAAVQYVYTS